MEYFDKPVYVTKPFLPNKDEFDNALTEIWDNQWLTNNGPILQRFYSKLCNTHKTENLSLFNNGTLALQVGLQALNLTGEVITTPFTFVATSHALFWNRLRPVFVDIEPDTYTISPEKVEAAITPWTSAILGVHVYGNPCLHKQLKDIAVRHNIKLIYDAAHAFGVNIDGKPISEIGDLSMFSFHATKLFHSFEGGMLIFKDNYIKHTVDYLKNFGFKNENEVMMPGTNAKMNEVQALMGEMNLSYLPKIILKRKELYHQYHKNLKDIDGIKLMPDIPENVEHNYGYMPVEIHEKDSGINRDVLYNELKKYNIYTRKYFYPLVCDFHCYRSLPLVDPLTVARDISMKILCLPLYYDLSLNDVDRICNNIRLIMLKK